MIQHRTESDNNKKEQNQVEDWTDLPVPLCTTTRLKVEQVQEQGRIVRPRVRRSCVLLMALLLDPCYIARRATSRFLFFFPPFSFFLLSFALFGRDMRTIDIVGWQPLRPVASPGE